MFTISVGNQDDAWYRNLRISNLSEVVTIDVRDIKRILDQNNDIVP